MDALAVEIDDGVMDGSVEGVDVREGLVGEVMGLKIAPDRLDFMRRPQRRPPRPRPGVRRARARRHRPGHLGGERRLVHGDETGTSTLLPGGLAGDARRPRHHPQRACRRGCDPLRPDVGLGCAPASAGGDPVRQTATPDLSRPGLVPVAGDAALPLDVPGATLAMADLAAGETVHLPGEPLVYAFVVTGALVRSSLAEPLAAGDAFEIVGESGLAVTAAVPTQLPVWTFAEPSVPTCQRLGAQGTSTPGLRIPSGSTAALAARSTAMPTGPISAPSHGWWSVPTAW